MGGHRQSQDESVSRIVFNTIKENVGRGLAGCVVSHLGFTIANVCVS